MIATLFRAAVLAVLLAGPAFAIDDPRELLSNPKLEARAEHIGNQLRCLVCQNESIEDSSAGLARDLRKIVRERVMAGDSDKQIIAWMVARYGDFVRLKPPFDMQTVLLWGSPLVAVGIGAVAFAVSRRHVPAPPTPLTDEERRRLAEL